MDEFLQINKVKLDDTELAYIKHGSGPALIMLAGIMSKIETWFYITEFLSQKFTVYLIELPGYGKSSPFINGYSSDLMGKVIDDFVTKLKIKRFSFIGFSFGGFVSLFALNNLIEKIDKFYLIAPCVSYRGLKLNRPKLIFTRFAIILIDNKILIKLLIKLLKNKNFANKFIYVITRFSNKDIYFYKDILSNTLSEMSVDSADVLIKQIKEVLFLSPIDKIDLYHKKVYLGMSKQDQLLDYERTYKLLNEKFSDLEVYEFNLPNHQPLEPMTQEYLHKNFGHILENM